MQAAACSNSTGTSHPGRVVVTITERDGSISASSDLVKADRGQPITFVVTSDVADEIRVQSAPEHDLDVKPGKDESFTFSVSTPGTAEVESEGLDQMVLKLEIR